MDERRLRLSPIEPKQKHHDTCLMPCFVYIFSREEAQNVISLVNSVCPLPRHLRHLKRVRNLEKTRPSSESKVLQILLMPTEGLSLDEFLEVYTELESLDSTLIREELVPARMANTRREWEEQHRMWPQSFHHHMHEKRRKAEHELIETLFNKLDTSRNSLVLIDPETEDIILEVERFCKCHNTFVLEHDVMRLIKCKALLPANGMDDYLCRDLVAILPEEPCLMCAMSLTHSRVRAIVLYKRASEDGPYTTHGLHRLVGLNHHYGVYHLSS